MKKITQEDIIEMIDDEGIDNVGEINNIVWHQNTNKIISIMNKLELELNIDTFLETLCDVEHYDTIMKK